jgi:hypothetical protein
VRLTLRGARRELRPHTRGVVRFLLRRRLRGPATARVAVATSQEGPALARTFRLRL